MAQEGPYAQSSEKGASLNTSDMEVFAPTTVAPMKME